MAAYSAQCLQSPLRSKVKARLSQVLWIWLFKISNGKMNDHIQIVRAGLGCITLHQIIP